MSTPVSTISGWPASTRSRAWSRTTFGSRLRLVPRAKGTMQKAQRCWQPSWTLRNARERPLTRASGAAAGARAADVGDLDAPREEPVEQLGQAVLVGVADDEVHLREA